MSSGSKKTAAYADTKKTTTPFQRLFRGNSALAIADSSRSNATSSVATQVSSSAKPSSPRITTQQKAAASSAEQPKLDLSSSNAALMNSFAESKNLQNIQNFVLHIIRTPEIAFFWGLYALDQAQQSNKWMATFLLEKLYEKELLFIFDALLRREQPETFCRGNQLAAKLIDIYLTKPEFQTFKALILEEVLSEKMLGTDSKNVLPNVLTKLLNFQQFPPLMQKILGAAYWEIQSRTNVKEDDKPGILLGMIFLKFIVPAITEKSMALEASLGDKIRRIISGSIQSWASKGNPANGATDDAAKIALFEKTPKELRKNLYVQVEKQLIALNIKRQTSFPEKMHDIDAAQMLAAELLETTRKWGQTEEQAGLTKQLVRLSAIFKTSAAESPADERPLSFLSENPISLAELSLLQEQLEKNTSATATTATISSGSSNLEERTLPPKPMFLTRKRAQSANPATPTTSSAPPSPQLKR